MSVIINKEQSYFFTSRLAGDSRDDNLVVSADGSRMTISLDNAISIPAGAVNTTVEVQQAAVWNISPNIAAQYNNNEFIYLINGIEQPAIIFPDGQYSLANINNLISRTFTNRGEDTNQIVLSANDSTQRVVATFNATIQADFTGANSIGSVLGFSALVPNPMEATDGYSVEGSDEAALNRINSYSISSNIVSQGIPINNIGLNIIASIPISVRPGSQIIYTPTNPTKINCNELRGKSKQQFYFELGDELGNAVPTLGESYSLLLVFKYSLLMTSESVPLLDI
jgi:hypothetical protein